MYLQNHIVVLTVFTFLFGAIQCQSKPKLPPVPCPRYFSYESNQDDVIEGKITVPVTQPISVTRSIKLQVNASMLGYFGPKYTKLKAKLLTPVLEIVQDKAEKLTYSISFPILKSIPTITLITVNGHTYCTGPDFKPTLDTAVTNMFVAHQISLGAGARSGAVDEEIHSYTKVEA